MNEWMNGSSIGSKDNINNITWCLLSSSLTILNMRSETRNSVPGLRRKTNTCNNWTDQMWPNLAYTPSWLAYIPGRLLREPCMAPTALASGNLSHGVWQQLLLYLTANASSSSCQFLWPPLFFLFFTLKKKKKNWLAIFHEFSAVLPFFLTFFTFSVLKERKEHESVRIVFEKLKLEKEPVVQEKLKGAKRTQ